MLNYREPQHPPDVYFIRRNPEMVKKYLDPKEMQTLIQKAKGS